MAELRIWAKDVTRYMGCEESHCIQLGRVLNRGLAGEVRTT